MSKLIPPDPKQCQAEVPGNGPFTMGGEIGDPRNGYRVRCKNKPTWIATEKKPGADGLIGSMSLCNDCRDELEKQMPDACSFKYVTLGNGISKCEECPCFHIDLSEKGDPPETKCGLMQEEIFCHWGEEIDKRCPLHAQPVLLRKAGT